MITVAPDTAIPVMSMEPVVPVVGLGSHAVATPVAALTAARPLLGCPPIDLYRPATYTVGPATASRVTRPSGESKAPSTGLGSQSVAFPVVASSAASPRRGWPPMPEKL